jgi:hypothetical protein
MINHPRTAIPARTTAPLIPVPAPALAGRLCGEVGASIDCCDENELERPIDVEALDEISKFEVTAAEVTTVVAASVVEGASIVELSTCHHINDTVEFPWDVPFATPVLGSTR